MKFREIASRLTGFSTPMFGASWNPPEAQRSVARRVLAFLEDRRVLYSPSEVESPDYCVRSVVEIRHFLTQELGALPAEAAIAQSLSAMRAACRKFMDTIGADGGRIIQYGASHGHYASWVFISALGELRGVVGIHVAAIAAGHGLDVEHELSAILPAKAGES